VATATQSFIYQAYIDLLAAPVDPGGLTFWTGLIDSHRITRDIFVSVLETTTAYKTNIINQLYLQYLGRPVDPSGLGFGLQILNGQILFVPGVSPANELRLVLLSSQEYFDRNGGNNAAYVSALYRDALGIAADPTGVVFYAGLLNGNIPRALVVHDFLGNLTAKTIIVEGFYHSYLRRAADPLALGFFPGFLLQGGSEDLVIRILVASDEYFNRL